MFVPLIMGLILLLAMAMEADCDLTVIQLNRTYPHRIAAFGPRIEEAGLIGKIFAPDSIDPSNKWGCKLSTPPETTQPWVALVLQGECTYLEKVRMMQWMGASAVIVGSTSPTSGLITMQASGDSSDIDIPSVYVVSYSELRQLQFPEYDVLLMMDDTRFWPVINVIIARIVAPALVMVFLYSIAFRCRQRQRERNTHAREEQVSNLPKRYFRKKESEEEAATCSICLEEYGEGDELRILPCKHEFHSSCIDPWLLTRKRFCPLCKAVAFPGEDTNLV